MWEKMRRDSVGRYVGYGMAHCSTGPERPSRHQHCYTIAPPDPNDPQATLLSLGKPDAGGNWGDPKKPADWNCHGLQKMPKANETLKKIPGETWRCRAVRKGKLAWPGKYHIRYEDELGEEKR